jgi:Rps23 Pro-64 3,4-dihydroxylase Tpa1-like proline 4-hydroxylase
LIQNNDWRLCYLSDTGPVCITQQEFRTYTQQQQFDLNRHILAKATSGFSYYYYRSVMGPHNAPNAELREFFNYVCGETFLSFIKSVTGHLNIITATGQATCYRPSCFLRRHNDFSDKENRAAAYVFGFTPDWQADWGGLLHIQDDNDAIVASHIPAFNTLTLFRVPRQHFVSQVASFAKGVRYTTTGWFLNP